MKKMIAIALIGVGAHWGSVQAKEPHNYDRLQTTTQTDLSPAVQRPQRRSNERRHRQAERPQLRPLSRAVSLQHAGKLIERLQQKKRRIERKLRHSRRHQAQHQQSQHLRLRLARVKDTLWRAQQDYRFYLKRELGGAQYEQLLQHTTWLNDSRRPRHLNSRANQTRRRQYH